MNIVHLSAVGSCRPIPDTDGCYLATERGLILSRFRSGRPFEMPDGSRKKQILPAGQAKVLSTYISAGTGYPMVVIRTRQGRRRANIHTLVLEAFIGSRPAGMESRHLDGNCLNACIENLRWGTPLENAQDKFRHGTVQLGEDHHSSKLTVDDVRKIKQMLRDKVLHQIIAPMFGVSRACISSIAIGRNWNHVQI